MTQWKRALIAVLAVFGVLGVAIFAMVGAYLLNQMPYGRGLLWVMVLAVAVWVGHMVYQSLKEEA
jgi:uncharacterized membrane protein